MKINMKIQDGRHVGRFAFFAYFYSEERHFSEHFKLNPGSLWLILTE
jgi:hypothetical protein